jgi:hypothetical protein
VGQILGPEISDFPARLSRVYQTRLDIKMVFDLRLLRFFREIQTPTFVGNQP